MNLVIDIGNTAIKVAFFQDSNLVTTAVYSHFETEVFKEAMYNSDYQMAIVSSVASLELTNQILNCVKKPLNLSEGTPLPFSNKYGSPTTLGKDRIANAAGGFTAFPNQNVLIVDAGTCLKFDIITNQKNYLGGSISPGLTMRFKALHNFTANLPLIEHYGEQPPLIGNDTQSSIKSGCINGMKNEIVETINQYNKSFNDLKIILTGGEAHFFENIVLSEKNSIFADPFLTLKGLNSILNHNA